MSKQVQIDYQQISITCHSICDVAQTRLCELDEILKTIESSSTKIADVQAKNLAQEIRSQKKQLENKIKQVLDMADEDAKKGVVTVDNESGTYKHSGDMINASDQLRSMADELSSQKLIEYRSLLTALLGENIATHQRKLREQADGVISIDGATQKLLDSIDDAVLRQFTLIAYLKDNTLTGDRLLGAGRNLKEQTVNETYESLYEKERAKIRAELDAARVAPETVTKIMNGASGSTREKLIALRQNATTEIVGEKVRQKSLKIIMEAIKGRGFVVDKKNIRINRDTNEVVMVALKASGEKAEFKVFLNGKFVYDFHGYSGQACQKDIEPFMRDLEEVYGMRIVKQQEIWSNPDKLSTMKYQTVNTNKNKR